METASNVNEPSNEVVAISPVKAPLQPEQLQRVVIKLGTQLLMDDEWRLNKPRLIDLVAQIAQLAKAGRSVLIVSSGAVGLGREQMTQAASSKSHAKSQSLDLTEKQACAAIGQSILMETYRTLFGLYQIPIAQVLLTADDFAHRTRYLNLQKTLEKLLSWGVIPILNENDVVSTAELEQRGQEKGFGDNDKLSALVASKLNADMLMILTNVTGIYTENPFDNPQAKKLSVIQELSELTAIQTKGKSATGRGGMQTKLEAARIAALSGTHTYITSGINPNAISEAFEAKPFHQSAGTWVLAQSTLSSKKRWIGLASGYQGAVVINAGAKKALVNQQGSLLPVGIIGVIGDFPADQVVSIEDEMGHAIGRGLVNFSAETLRQIQGKPSDEVLDLLIELSQGTDISQSDSKSAPNMPLNNPSSGRDTVVIFRENLVLFENNQALNKTDCNSDY